MSEGSVAQWLAADGATVHEGAPLFVVESDKSTNEVEAPATGALRILTPAGEVVPVGTLIAEIT
jgi:pyruvate/2-oxoglutarate dehydrogenase complex dihydrolipoamide acyltransferase (E2) component